MTGKSKYEGSYETLLRAVIDYTRSGPQTAEGYRRIVFNCLIGNGDAHLKNFAVRYQPYRLAVTLTPPYDITHTLIYPSISPRMALKINGSRRFPDFNALVRLGPGAAQAMLGDFPKAVDDAVLDSNDAQKSIMMQYLSDPDLAKAFARVVLDMLRFQGNP